MSDEVNFTSADAVPDFWAMVTERQRDEAAFRQAMALDRRFIILRNGRRLAARKWRKSANWVIAMQLFGLGSTYARRMCVELGFDPDGLTFKDKS